MDLKAILISVLLLTLSSNGALASTQEEKLRHSALVAAFVYSFSKFVLWPSETFASDTSPINLCVKVAPENFGLWKLYEGKKSQGRVLQVLTFASKIGPINCHMAFFNEASSTETKSRIANNLNKPVLTIGVSEYFLSQGGMINLRRAENNIKFSINLTSVHSSELKIHSRLLSLAESLYEKGE